MKHKRDDSGERVASDETVRILRLISHLNVGEHCHLATVDIETKPLGVNPSRGELQTWHESSSARLRTAASRYFTPSRRFKLWRISFQTVGVKRLK